MLQSEESEEGGGRVGSKEESLASRVQSMVDRGDEDFCTDDDHEVKPYTSSYTLPWRRVGWPCSSRSHRCSGMLVQLLRSC